MNTETADTTAANSYSERTNAHALGGTTNMGIALRNQLIAAALLAVVAISVIGSAVLFGLDEPYAVALGAITVALVKVDDARIRRARRRVAVAP